MSKPSSNWGNLKSKLSKVDHIVAKSSSAAGREKRTDLNKACKGVEVVVAKNDVKKDETKLGGDHMNAKMKSNYVGLDCEMVGIGLTGKQSALARCCMVDFEGLVIYDKYVRPKGFVTDFRTQWSGIRKQDLRAGEAITLLECQEDVTALLKNKFLVGHALKNDLDVLMLGHPKKMIRDTACYKPYMRPSGRNGGKMKPRSLKELTKQHLGLQIQTGEHDPGEDARSAMFLYRLKMKEWEESMKASRALQSAAFKNNTGGPASSSSSVSTTVHATEERNERHERHEKGGMDKEVYKALSGKEKRNLRRNGVQPKSLRVPEESSSSSSSSSGGGRGGGRDSGGINSAGGRNSTSSSSSSSSSSGVGGKSVSASKTVTTSSSSGSKSISVSSTINVRTTDSSSGSSGSSSSSSSAASTVSVSSADRKRKASTVSTGMFLNDVTTANSISEVDKRMGTTATKVSTKKQRR